MKMFKRLAAFGAAAILALSMGITAFADGSPSTSGVVSSTVVSATDANGNSVKITVGAQSEVKNEEARKILNTSEKDILVQTNDPNASVEGMKLVDLREVTVEGDVTFPLDITFKISGVTADSKVSVLHFDTEKNAWESVPVKVNSDGTVTVTFNSLSPVAFFVNGAASNAAGTTSPKTGSSPVMMIAVLGAIVCAGGAFAFSKKRA